MLLKCRTNYACICYYVKQITDDNFSCFCTFLISWTLYLVYLSYTLKFTVWQWWVYVCDIRMHIRGAFLVLQKAWQHSSPTIVMYNFIVAIYSMYIPIYCRYVHRIIHTVTPNPYILSNVSIVKSVVRTWFVRLTNFPGSAGAP